MADRTKRSEEKKKQAKEKRRVKEKRQKRQRRKRRQKRRSRRRGPWLALQVDECLELPLALLPTCRLHNNSGESLAGGIPAGGVGTLQTWNGDRQPVMPVMSVMSSMSWFLMQVSETERIQRTLVRWWISQQDLHSPRKTRFAGPLVAGFQPHGKPTQFLKRTALPCFSTTGMAQLHRKWLQNDADVGSTSRPGSRTASRWKSRCRMMAWSLEIEVKDDVHQLWLHFKFQVAKWNHFSKRKVEYSGISSGMKLEWSYPTGEMSSFWRLGASSCVFEARSLCVTGSCIRPSRRPDRVIQVQGLQLSHHDAKG